MSIDFNYRHLYYFWVVAKEGGMARAANRLDMAVQTVSAQVRELERDLGHSLLKPVVMHQAEQIFQLGEQLPSAIRSATSAPSVRLTVGISEGLAKLAIRKLMQPVMQAPHLRLLCRENDCDDLLGDLALHRLDVVLADRPAPANPNLKVYSHARVIRHRLVRQRGASGSGPAGLSQVTVAGAGALAIHPRRSACAH
jgi:LysR family transcriptional regulator, transcriptional activator of nhaA